MSRSKEVVRNCKWVAFIFALASLFPAWIWRVQADESWTMRSWETMLDFSSSSRLVKMAPLAEAEKRWTFCALYPHLKDSYWLSVNYGMVVQAKKLGVALRIFEAGGYFHAARQAEQLEACVDARVDAILLGTVTHSGHTERIREIARTIPVFGLVNNINPDGISGMTGVDWTNMGLSAGRFLEKRHPKGSEIKRLAWFPGAGKTGISSTKMIAFQDALAGSSAEISTIKYGDTGKMVQLTLIEELLETDPDIDYIVGTGVTAEAAISALKLRGLENRIAIISSYFTHGVYRGIKRGRILSAPTDQPVLQGRMSVDQAVRMLEGKHYLAHIGPQILFVTKDNIEDFSSEGSLSPSTFRPTFRVDAKP